MSDPVEEVDLSSPEVDAVTTKFARSFEALEPVTAQDSTGAVSVTLDKAGRISSVVVGSQWITHYTAATLVGGIIEAATTAGTSRFEHYGQQFACLPHHRSSVIGKLDRLSRDPVALAREFRLRD